MFSALAAVCTVDCAIEIVLITLHYITSLLAALQFRLSITLQLPRPTDHSITRFHAQIIHLSLLISLMTMGIAITPKELSRQLMQISRRDGAMLLGVYTFRSSETDRSVRLVGPTIVPCKRPVIFRASKATETTARTRRRDALH